MHILCTKIIICTQINPEILRGGSSLYFATAQGFIDSNFGFSKSPLSNSGNFFGFLWKNQRSEKFSIEREQGRRLND